jgi:hypothetical protein
LTDILFDLETKIRELLKGNSKALGLQPLDTIPEAKKPEPEKIQAPTEPKPTTPTPTKTYFEGSPMQRTKGKLGMVEPL